MVDDTKKSPEEIEEEVETPKRGRGRPKGSTKQRVEAPKLILPPEMVTILAGIPLSAADQVCRHFAGFGLAFSGAEYQACACALKAYLDTANIPLTPGWACLLVYVSIIGAKVGGGAMANAIGEEKAADKVIDV